MRPQCNAALRPRRFGGLRTAAPAGERTCRVEHPLHRRAPCWRCSRRTSPMRSRSRDRIRWPSTTLNRRAGRRCDGGGAPLQADRRRRRGARRADGGAVRGDAGDGAGRDRARSRCHRRPGARRPGGALLPRLLRLLLLSGAVHHLWRPRSALPPPAHVDAAAGAVDELATVVRRRTAARSGRLFCREADELVSHDVDFVLGVAKSRPAARIAGSSRVAAATRQRSALPQLPLRTLKSWSRTEWLPAATGPTRASW